MIPLSVEAYSGHPTQENEHNLQSSNDSLDESSNVCDAHFAISQTPLMRLELPTETNDTITIAFTSVPLYHQHPTAFNL